MRWPLRRKPHASSPARPDPPTPATGDAAPAREHIRRDRHPPPVAVEPPIAHPPWIDLPWAPASWLTYPTLQDGNGATSKTAGVAHYRQAIQSALDQFGPLVTAELRIEQAGPYAGAVRVFIQGAQVGAIASTVADSYREIVHTLNLNGQVATCRAEIEIGQYVDVWLSAKPKARPDGDPFIPDLGPGVRVALNEQGNDYLEQVLGQRAKNKRIKRLSDLCLQSDTWHLAVDEHAIGALPPGHYARLTEAARSDNPMICRVAIVRQEGRPLRVTAGIPTG